MNKAIELTKAKQYVRDLTGGGLLLAESRLVAETLLQALPEKDWNHLFTDENILKKIPLIPLFAMLVLLKDGWNL